MTIRSPIIRVKEIDGLLFDLDGVVTKTAAVHAASWKRLFDEYLAERGERNGDPFRPFDIDSDYRNYVDGEPRYAGVQHFLESRGIALPYGAPDDDPEQETVCGLGNRKNRYFQEHLRKHGVEVYESSIELIRRARSLGLKTAVVSSSKNCAHVVEAAGITGLFDVRVDGVEIARAGMKGKPAPDVFLRAARLMNTEPTRAAVFEDAISGVKAGRNGGFSVVVGVDRTGHPEVLRENGADIVVSDLADLVLADDFRAGERSGREIPSALEQIAEIKRQLVGKRLAVFLDYDGTLTPIVERPELAVLADDMRSTLKDLARCCTVAIVSGRDLHDVENLVRVDGIFYAGSHGFRISGPGEWKHASTHGIEFVPTLDMAEKELRERIERIPGAIVERKYLSIAVHYRLVSSNDVKTVEAIVDGVLARHRTLRKSSGKKVFDLQPNIDWNKGKAVLWLLDALGLDPEHVVALYIGDDVTDEDAFRALADRGIGIVVMDRKRPSAARYALENPVEVRHFFEELVSVQRDVPDE